MPLAVAFTLKPHWKGEHEVCGSLYEPALF